MVLPRPDTLYDTLYRSFRWRCSMTLTTAQGGFDALDPLSGRHPFPFELLRTLPRIHVGL